MRVLVGRLLAYSCRGEYYRLYIATDLRHFAAHHGICVQGVFEALLALRWLPSGALGTAGGGVEAAGTPA